MILKKTNTKMIMFELQQVYGSECLSERTVYGWVGQFKHGRTGVFVEECSRPPTEINEKQKKN